MTWPSRQRKQGREQLDSHVTLIAALALAHLGTGRTSPAAVTTDPPHTAGGHSRAPSTYDTSLEMRRRPHLKGSRRGSEAASRSTSPARSPRIRTTRRASASSTWTSRSPARARAESVPEFRGRHHRHRGQPLRELQRHRLRARRGGLRAALRGAGGPPAPEDTEGLSFQESCEQAIEAQDGDPAAWTSTDRLVLRARERGDRRRRRRRGYARLGLARR